MSRIALVFSLLTLGPTACLDPIARRPLRVVDSVPRAGGDHPSGDPIRVIFDGYLDPSINLDRAAVLASGDIVAAADVGYDPSGPALVIVPQLDLRADLAYQVTLDPARVVGLDGRTLEAPLTIGFTARSTPTTPPPDPVIFSRDLAPIFESRCGCHGPEPLAFPPLTPRALVGVASPSDPTMDLVAPGDPLRSVLLLKVLPDYPQIFGLGMPAEGPPLDGATLRKLVSWIQAGAIR